MRIGFGIVCVAVAFLHDRRGHRPVRHQHRLRRASGRQRRRARSRTSSASSRSTRTCSASWCSGSARCCLLVGAATTRDGSRCSARARSTYMVTTGVVYNLLLRNIPLPQGTTVGWSNEMLHVVAPAVPADRLAVRPGAHRARDCGRVGDRGLPDRLGDLHADPRAVRRRPSRESDLVPVSVPQPATRPNGYLSVPFYVVLIAVVILCAGYGVVWISRRWRVGPR